jgi:CRISPR-associated protein Cmr2
LHDLRRFLADDGVSRRAVYNTLDWLKDLPQDNEDMLRSLLAYQLARQADKSAGEEHKVDELARRIARVAFDDGLRRAPRRDEKRLDWLAHFMSAAEFLARETRGAD